MGKKFIPALRFEFLNNLFDTFLKIMMKEEKIKNELIKFSNIKGAQTIMDFGCGTGTLIKMLLEKIPNLNIIGVDIDQDILDIAKEKITMHNPLLIKYDGKTLPFADNYFDNVLSSLVVHHLDTDSKILIFKEIHRVLKSDGAFYILDFAQPDDMYSKCITLLLKFIEPINDNIEGKIPVMLDNCGFRNVNQHGYYKTAFGALTIYSGTK